MEPRVEGNGGSYGVFRGDCKLGSFWQPRAEHTQAALYMFSCMHMLLEFVLCMCYELVLPITYGQYVQRTGECVWLQEVREDCAVGDVPPRCRSVGRRVAQQR